MKSFVRTIVIAAALALPLSGCVNFDPTEWIDGDWFGSKKPLPGERKELFPGGVPGVSKGVPSDLIKGNQAAALADEKADEPPQVREEPKPKPKPKAKPKPKPQVAQDADESRPTPVTVRPQAQPQQQPQRSQGSIWPDPPQAQPRPQSGGVAWPDPPSPR